MHHRIDVDDPLLCGGGVDARTDEPSRAAAPLVARSAFNVGVTYRHLTGAVGDIAKFMRNIELRCMAHALLMISHPRFPSDPCFVRFASS